MSFERAKQFVLAQEGGLANDPDDPGGRTDRGVSARAHPDIWADGVVSDEELDAVYRGYWDEAGCEALPWPLSLAAFDFAFNSGVGRASTFMRHLRERDLTGTAAPLADALTLIAMRVRFLRDLAGARQASQKYLRGWLNRCADLASVCIKEGDGT